MDMPDTAPAYRHYLQPALLVGWMVYTVITGEMRRDQQNLQGQRIERQQKEIDELRAMQVELAGKK